MKISNATIDILKNYATINQGIVVRKGNELKTVSPEFTILAAATVAESFPSDFGIYDLPNLLAVFSLYEEPNLEFGDKQMKISVGNSVTTYRYTDPKMIVVPPDKKLVLTSKDLTFKLSAADLDKTLKTADVLCSPNIYVIANGKKLVLSTLDVKNDSAHTNTLTLCDTDKTLKMLFKRDNFKMVPGVDYDVTLCEKGFAQFINKKLKLEYFVSAEKDKSAAKKE